MPWPLLVSYICTPSSPSMATSPAQHHPPLFPLPTTVAVIQARLPFVTMIKLRYSKRLFKRSSSKGSTGSSGDGDVGVVRGGSGEIEWEVRPGGMLVQKREGRGDVEVITVRVATGFSWHDVSIGATCTFGELKVMLSMVTGLEPREQRLLFRGKEREDSDHLHMVWVRDKDKVLLVEDPALKDMKLRATLAAQALQSPIQPFIQV